LELPAKLSEISEKIKSILNVHLEQIGLILENFFVISISADKEDLEKLRLVKEKRMEAMTDIDIESIKAIRMSQARAVARETEGYSYQDERKFDILQAAAANEGVSGSIMGAGMGLGVGFGVGEEVSKVANQTFNQPKSALCPNCQNPVGANSKFCSSCGQSLAPKKSFCINCGAELATGAQFCSECGAKQQMQERICPSCGTTINAGCKFCPTCGKSLS
jgi:membrane protease subunit (stomatin/prohibitin family)